MNGYSVVAMIGFYAITLALIFDFLKIESTLNRKSFVLLVVYPPLAAVMVENQETTPDALAMSFFICLFLLILILLFNASTYTQRIGAFFDSLDEAENKDAQDNSNSINTSKEGGEN